MAIVNQITPPVGVRGKFKVAAPFDQLVSPNVDFECVAVQEFKHLYADGIDPYEEVYLPVALTEEHVANDVTLEVRIVTLMSATGINVKIPSRYITGMPNPADITYVNAAIVATLSAIPSTTSVSDLIVTINDLIQNRFGIKPIVQLVKYGIDESVTQTEHQSIVASRNRAITQAVNPTASAKNYQDLYNRERTLRKALEKSLIKAGITN